MKVPKQVTFSEQELDLEMAVAKALEKILAPVVNIICEMECIRRKEFLMEKEAALLYSLSPSTLKTQRSRGGGPIHKKLGNKVLYARKDLEIFLNGPFTTSEDVFLTSKAGGNDNC